MSNSCLDKIASLIILNAYYGFLLNLSRPPIQLFLQFNQIKNKTNADHFSNVFSLLTPFLKKHFKQLKIASKRLRCPHTMSRICLEAFSSLNTKNNKQLKTSPGDGRGKNNI